MLNSRRTHSRVPHSNVTVISGLIQLNSEIGPKVAKTGLILLCYGVIIAAVCSLRCLAIVSAVCFPSVSDAS